MCGKDELMHDVRERERETLPPRASFRKRAENVLAATFRGLHHVPYLHRAKWSEKHVRVTLHDSLATFDYDELTRLVVAAHDQCVRAEVVPLGRHLGLFLHDRQRSGEVWARHPGLEEHVAWLRSHADAHWRRVHEDARAIVESTTTRGE